MNWLKKAIFGRHKTEANSVCAFKCFPVALYNCSEFSQGTEQGFYNLDLPRSCYLSVTSRGMGVGAAMKAFGLVCRVHPLFAKPTPVRGVQQSARYPCSPRRSNQKEMFRIVPGEGVLPGAGCASAVGCPHPNPLLT